MSKTQKKGLGRGLSALLADDRAPVAAPADSAADTPARGVRYLPISAIARNPEQPRRLFDSKALDELAVSLKKTGLLQPVLVRPDDKGNNSYQIVAGERRWRAAQKAGLHDIPVIVKDLNDGEVLEIAIVENIQRENLTPIEEAQGYRRLMDEFGHTQVVLAGLVGKSRSHIANLLRLLDLPGAVHKMLESGDLTMGHARALIGSKDPVALARRIVRDGLSVRKTEALVGAEKAPTGEKLTKNKGLRKDADTKSLEKDLSAATGCKVTIDHKGSKGGVITLAYPNLDLLDEICERLQRRM